MGTGEGFQITLLAREHTLVVVGVGVQIMLVAREHMGVGEADLCTRLAFLISCSSRLSGKHSCGCLLMINTHGGWSVGWWWGVVAHKSPLQKTPVACRAETSLNPSPTLAGTFNVSKVLRLKVNSEICRTDVEMKTLQNVRNPKKKKENMHPGYLLTPWPCLSTSVTHHHDEDKEVF